MTEFENAKAPTPENHYDWGMDRLALAQTLPQGDGTMTQTNLLLSAIAHAMLGGLRDGLDYAAEKARRELDEEVKKQQEALSRPVAFEEDEDRP